MEFKITEKDVRKTITDYLKILQKMGKLFWYWNYQTLGSFPGISDLTILLPGGKVIFCEIKRSATCKLSIRQQYFKDQCMRLGHLYIVCFSLNDLINDLNKILGIGDNP